MGLPVLICGKDTGLKNMIKRTVAVFAAFAAAFFLLLWSEDKAFATDLKITDAEEFTVEEHKNSILVTLQNPYPGAVEPARYLLVPRGTDTETAGLDNFITVEVPVRRSVSTTTVNLAFMRQLGVTDSLVGLGGRKYVYSPDEYEVNLPEVGEGMNLDLEEVIRLAPDVVFAYAFSPSEVDNFKRLEKIGIKVVYMSEYLEKTPLGRAEWIKYLSLFFCREERASDLFEKVRNNYLSLVEKASSARRRPSVLVNKAMSGTWYVPAGDNWFSHLLQDSGASYPWAHAEGDRSIPLDLETVLEKAARADYWINPGLWETLDDGLREDERYFLFKAFRLEQVYNNTARYRKNGGNDYHQSGVMRPDILLKDLVSVFHPEILPDHRLVYYRKLKWQDENQE